MLSANLHVDSFRETNDLSNSARFFLILLAAIMHVWLGWMLLRIPTVRTALAESVPVFVYMVKPAAISEPPSQVVKPLEPLLPVIEKPKPKKRPLPVAEKPAIQEKVIEVMPPVLTEPAPSPPTVAVPVVASKASPVVMPKMISVSAVRYRKAPVPVYPIASRRLKETGETLVRVLIDQNGAAQRLLIEQSSGYERLDEAATAAINEASFYPYTENSIPFPVWVVIPVSFNLR